MSMRKNSTWPLVFAAGIILLPVLYVLSAGPMVWLARHDYVPIGWLEIYCPLEWSLLEGPDWWGSILEAYGKLWD
jgi:hypothetical protein